MGFVLDTSKIANVIDLPPLRSGFGGGSNGLGLDPLWDALCADPAVKQQSYDIPASLWDGKDFKQMSTSIRNNFNNHRDTFAPGTRGFEKAMHVVQAVDGQGKIIADPKDPKEIVGLKVYVVHIPGRKKGPVRGAAAKRQAEAATKKGEAQVVTAGDVGQTTAAALTGKGKKGKK